MCVRTEDQVDLQLHIASIGSIGVFYYYYYFGPVRMKKIFVKLARAGSSGV